MKNLWDRREAARFENDPLAMRVYSSRLLGRDDGLVMHGGGNTSVKTTLKNLFGEFEEVLYVKGSGWDLATIEAEGFAPVKMDMLLKMAGLPSLSDSEMVKWQRAAMLDPNAPNPSVEAILHAIIPFKFVDHTHADSVVTITNTPKGRDSIRRLYGERVIVVPYVMPGFILARKIHEMTRGINWQKYEGMVLLNHGIFTFGDDAKASYDRMITLVAEAEDFIAEKSGTSGAANRPETGYPITPADTLELAAIRQAVSAARGKPLLAHWDSGPKALHFSALPDVSSLATRGPLTPDHIIRTKRTAVIFAKSPAEDVNEFVGQYKAYFNRYADATLTMLDPAPRWGVWLEKGVVHFGGHAADLEIVSDIIDHTAVALEQAESLGGWRALSEKDLFEMEYWELEQAKLKKGGSAPPLQGKIALVTGAASGIGRACVEALHQQGAAVAALDINPEVEKRFSKKGILPFLCDLTVEDQIGTCLEKLVTQFGGLDIVVSNAGIFPLSEKISELKQETWQRSLDINLTSHQRLLTLTAPYLAKGIDPTCIIIGSKNVPAPGPGVAAYSVAKAGLTQLARVAALELASLGIRVNVVHPNQVFDTAIWTPEVLEKRAEHYQMSVEEYKKSNLLKTEITSRHVADLVSVMAGPAFFKTTGAQIPIDGGNERII